MNIYAYKRERESSYISYILLFEWIIYISYEIDLGNIML